MSFILLIKGATERQLLSKARTRRRDGGKPLSGKSNLVVCHRIDSSVIGTIECEELEHADVFEHVCMYVTFYTKG